MTDHGRGGGYGEAGLAGRRSGPGSGLEDITRVERTPERKELRVELARTSGGRLRCPHCGEACPGYDTRRREWRNLDAWGYSTFLVCDVPRVRCREHGVVTMQVPWAEGSSRYTAEFEAEVILWLKEASVRAVAQRMRLSWNAADGIMQRAVARGLARRPEQAVRHLSVDETAFRRRHRYVTVVSNPKKGIVLHVARGRGPGRADGPGGQDDPQALRRDPRLASLPDQQRHARSDELSGPGRQRFVRTRLPHDRGTHKRGRTKMKKRNDATQLRGRRKNNRLQWLLLFVLMNVPVSLMTGLAFAQTVPGQVRNGSAVYQACYVGSQGATIKFSWNAPSSFGDAGETLSHYRIFAIANLQQDLNASPGLHNVLSDSSYTTLETLTMTDARGSNNIFGRPSAAGTRFRGFWVRVTNSNNEDSPGGSDLINPTYPVPPDVASVTATRDGAESIAVSWPAVTGEDFKLDGIGADGTVVAATGWHYYVRRRVKVGDAEWGGWSSGQPDGLPSTNEWTDTNVEANNTYQYRVKAHTNCKVLSANWVDSPEIPPPTAPDAPALAASPTMKVVDAVLTITPDSNDGGEPVTSINLYRRNSGVTPTTDWPAKGTPDMTFTTIEANNLYTFTGLAPDSTYEFRATTVNSIGESDYSTIRSGKTVATAVPAAFASSGKTTSEVTLGWNDVMYAIGYSIQWRKGNSGMHTETPEITDTSYPVTGLEANTAYEFQLRTKYSATVFSSWSTKIDVTTDPLPLVLVLTVTDEVAAYADAGEEVCTTATATGGAGEPYTYTGEVCANAPAPGQSSDHSVTVTDSGGNLDTAEWTLTTAAIPPQQVRNGSAVYQACYVGSQGATIKFSWNAPSSFGDAGETLSHYRIFAIANLQQDLNASPGLHNVLSDSSYTTLETLTMTDARGSNNIFGRPSAHGTRFRGFWVRVTNSNNEDSPGGSDLINPTYPVPPDVASVTATRDGAESIAVSWPAVTGEDFKLDGIGADGTVVAATGWHYYVRRRVKVGDAEWGGWSSGQPEGLPSTNEWTDTNIEANNTYQYRVKAHTNCKVLSANWVDSPEIPPPVVPEKPSNLRATRDGTNIMLTWSQGGSTVVTGYLIQVRENNAANWTDLEENTQNSDRTYVHRGTRSGTRYGYRVAGLNAAGQSPFSETVDVPRVEEAEAPAKVGDLTVGRQFPNIQLSWTAPNDGGSSITGYRIEVAVDDEKWSDLSLNTASQSTTYLHLRVNREKRYAYRISAINAVGTGPASDVVESPIDLTVPTVVQNVHAMRDHPDIMISWKVPADDGGTSILGYKIEVAVNNAEFVTLVERTSHNSYTHRDTSRRMRYRYRISAINARGTSPVSAIADVPINVTTPSGPRDVRATNVGVSSVRIEWVVPVDDGGADITGYQIDYRQLGRSAWLVLERNTGVSSALNYIHEDVDEDRTYEYRIAARNRIGLGLWSSVTNVRTDGTPGPPKLEAKAGRAEIELRWKPPASNGGSSISGYHLDVSEDAGARWFLLAEVGRHVRGYTHEDLASGVTRDYRLRAENAVGLGEYSNVVTATTDIQPASQPRDFQGNALSHGIELRWLKPLNTGGGKIESYRIEISINGRSWSLITNGVTETGYIVTGLEPDIWRHFRVAAINERGVGAWSEIIRVRTQPVIPDPPIVRKAVAISPTKIIVGWHAPRFTGGANTPLIGFKIESHNVGDWVTIYKNTNSLVTSFTHTGLEPGTEYFYRISAVNSVGTSEPSGIVSARTQAIGHLDLLSGSTEI